MLRNARQTACWLALTAVVAGMSGTVEAGPDSASFEIVVNAGHNAPVIQLEISREGRYLASRCKDGLVKLWDLSTGMLIRTWPRGTFGYERMALSPDGRWLATQRLSAKDSLVPFVELWDTASGMARTVLSPEQVTVPGDEPSVTAMAFNADATYLVLATHVLPIPLLGPDEGKEEDPPDGAWLSRFEIGKRGRPDSIRVSGRRGGRDAEILALALTRDGNKALVGTQDGFVQAVDLAGKQVHAPVEIAGHPVRRVALSPDERRLVVLATPEGKAWAGQVLASLDPTTLDAQASNIADHPSLGRVVEFAFSGPDAIHVLSEGRGLEAYSFASRRFSVAANVRPGIVALAAAPSRFFAAVATKSDGGIRLTGNAIWSDARRLPVGAGPATRVCFSGDGRELFALRGSVLRRWPLTPAGLIAGDAALTADLVGPFDTVTDIAPAESGNIVVLVHGTPAAGGARSLLVKRGEGQETALEGSERHVSMLPVLNNNGRHVFGPGSAGEVWMVRVWNGVTGKLEKALGPFPKKSELAPTVVASDVGPGKPATVFLERLVGMWTFIECWDVGKGKRLWSSRGGTLGGLSVASPSRRLWVQVERRLGLVRVVDLTSVQKVRELDIPALKALDDIVDPHLTPDEKHLVLHRESGSSVWIDLRSGIGRNEPPRSTSPPEPSATTCVHELMAPQRSPDGRLDARARRDGAIDVLSAGTRAPLVRLLRPSEGADESEWIVQTPDGYYAASSRCARAVGIRRGAATYSFDQFDLVFNRPDLVFSRLGASSGSITALRTARRQRLARHGLSADPTPPDIRALPRIRPDRSRTPILHGGGLSVRIPFDLQTTASPIRRLRVTVNDVPDAEASRALRPVESKNGSGSVDVVLADGRNVIQISVVDADGRESLRERIEIAGDSHGARRKLYVLAVGINAYEDEYELKYAAADATAVAGAFAKINKFEFEVRSSVILNKEAKRDVLLAKGKEFLAAAKPEDTVVVFFAGHGVLENGRFHFVTVDTDFERPEGKSISAEDLESLLVGVRARKKLMLIDACHAGPTDEMGASLPVEGALPTGVVARAGKRGTRDRRPRANHGGALLRDLFADLSVGSGTVTLTASGAEQFALERAGVGHGVFTQAVLEGLVDLRADQTLDRRVSVRELQDYVRERVRELTGGRQVPTYRRQVLEVDFFLR